MNRERAKELLPVIQAFAEGKTVQFRGTVNDSMWQDDLGKWSVLEFDIEEYEYRIKPEPSLVPYTAEELIPFIGEKFRHKTNGYIGLLGAIQQASKSGICVSGYGWESLENFHEFWEHYDGPGNPGRPIGKVVE